MKDILLKAIELNPEERMPFLQSYEIDITQLANNIGDSDPQLRDELVFRIFVESLFSNTIPSQQLNELLERLPSKDFLFYQIGATDDVSVYKRSFSALWLSYLLKYDQSGEIFDKQKINNMLDIISSYLMKERDGRGFVENEGWANAVGHAGDMYLAALQHPNFDMKYVPPILQGIKSSLWNGLVFVDDEEMKFANFIIQLQRIDYPEEVVVEWVEQIFDQLDYHLMYKGYSKEYFKARTNSLHFMQTLYFKCKFSKLYPKVMSTASYFIAKNQSV